MFSLGGLGHDLKLPSSDVSINYDARWPMYETMWHLDKISLNKSEFCFHLRSEQFGLAKTTEMNGKSAITLIMWHLRNTSHGLRANRFRLLNRQPSFLAKLRDCHCLIFAKHFSSCFLENSCAGSLPVVSLAFIPFVFTHLCSIWSFLPILILNFSSILVFCSIFALFLLLCYFPWSNHQRVSFLNT